MKSAFLTKAALCICPPAVVATTAATVPPVRKAVHRFTAAYEPKVNKTPAAAPCVPLQPTALGLPNYDFGPIAIDEPAAYGVITPSPDAPFLGPNLPVVPPIGPGVLPNPPIGNDVPGVPEPGIWLTMVIGFGMIGAGYRQRNRYLIRSRKLALATGAEPVSGWRGLGAGFGTLAAAGGSVLGGGLSPAQAGGRLAQIGSKALNSSLLAKTAMCVCPPVAMAVTTAAVPPVRHAVYKATEPRAPIVPATYASRPEGVPCVPVVVPTAAEAVKTSGETLAVLDKNDSWPS